VIEVNTFRLVDGADEEAFLAADKRVQQEFIPNKRGFVRRTTAKGKDGDWAVVVLWYEEANADAARADAEDDPVMAEFAAFIDTSTYNSARYFELPG
jgi:hypothetical protein